MDWGYIRRRTKILRWMSSVSTWRSRCIIEAWYMYYGLTFRSPSLHQLVKRAPRWIRQKTGLWLTEASVGAGFSPGSSGACVVRDLWLVWRLESIESIHSPESILSGQVEPQNERIVVFLPSRERASRMCTKDAMRGQKKLDIYIYYDGGHTWIEENALVLKGFRAVAWRMSVEWTHEDGHIIWFREVSRRSLGLRVSFRLVNMENTPLDRPWASGLVSFGAMYKLGNRTYVKRRHIPRGFDKNLSQP